MCPLAYNGQIYNEEGRRHRRPCSVLCRFAASSPRPLNVRRLAVRHQHVLVVTSLNHERIILFLKPYEPSTASHADEPLPAEAAKRAAKPRVPALLGGSKR